jgi:hypothetical protein
VTLWREGTERLYLRSEAEPLRNQRYIGQLYFNGNWGNWAAPRSPICIAQ